MFDLKTLINNNTMNT